MLIHRIYISFSSLLLICGAQQPPGNNTDLDTCKVSHLGVEFLGSIAKTESFARCQSWTSDDPHHIDESLSDSQFPDGSRRQAKNYCRNPTRDPIGPWCYTVNLDLKYETCAIPLCSFTECRVTGPGVEYAGRHKKSLSDNNCLKWNKNRKRVKENGTYRDYDKFDQIKFADENLSDAKKYCRNPSGDLAGPWCFVENEDTNEIERELCDIPFCDEPDCQVFTTNVDRYTHFTDFNSTLTNITFGLKVWDSDSYLDANASLALSLLALPMTGEEMDDMGVGIEICITNKMSALTFGNKDKPDYEETQGILKSTSYTWFDLSWTAPFVTLSVKGQKKPIFLAEYKTKKKFLGFARNKFAYYSAKGANVFWSFPFCLDDYECDVHTTVGILKQQFWPLRRFDVAYELHFHLRAFHSIEILFTQCPAVDFPNLKFSLQTGDKLTTILANYPGSPPMTIKEIELPDILNYWEWREYSISFFAESMHFHWIKSTGTNEIFELHHEIFRSLRWYTVGSVNTVAHWSFFCKPPLQSKPRAAHPPECALNAQEVDYRGRQDVTSLGLPCIPWSAKKSVPELIRNGFRNNSILKSWNYCRDPLSELDGTFCYTMETSPELKIEKNPCKLRKCKSEECKMAGTANDYVGSLIRTRSNRTCDYWFTQRTVHPHDPQYHNNTLFADIKLPDTRNFCRNPSRDLTGTWCYTTDAFVDRDLCNVRDCDRPEENIIIVSTGEGRNVYILSEWKISGLKFAIKQWNPNLVDGVMFIIKSSIGDDVIKLLIGAEGNQKIELYFNNKLEKHKTYPHLLSFGKWTDFWLKLSRGDISLGFKGVPNALFEYKRGDMFEPAFMTFLAIRGNPMGLFFESHECHTENVTTNYFDKVVPIGLWNQNGYPTYNSFNLTVRARGVFLIRFMTLTVNNPYFFHLKFDTIRSEVTFLYASDVIVTVKAEGLIRSKSWRSLTVTFSESTLKITSENRTVLNQRQNIKILLFYWFSVSVESGWATWIANCEPVDIDGPPRDGGWSGWSPWQCTVSCGGGEGFRTRTCTNPSPNFLGNLCYGSSRSTGICNDFICGDVSTTTLEKIRKNLQIQQYSYVIKEGFSVIIENDEDLLNTIRKESADAYYEWTLNGKFVKPEKGQISFIRDDIRIEEARMIDAGVYVCMLYRVNKKRVVLRVVSLAVKSADFTVETRATRSFVLVCNSVVLAYIYSSLSLKLLVNDKIYKDFGTTMLAAVNAEHFDSLNTSLSGDWQCIVEQKDLGLKWVTNYLRLSVDKAPNFYTNLMEDALTKPLFGWLENEENVFYALICIVVVIIVLVALCTLIYFKFCTLRTRWQ